MTCSAEICRDSYFVITFELSMPEIDFNKSVYFFYDLPGAAYPSGLYTDVLYESDDIPADVRLQDDIDYTETIVNADRQTALEFWYDGKIDAETLMMNPVVRDELLNKIKEKTGIDTSADDIFYTLRPTDSDRYPIVFVVPQGEWNYEVHFGIIRYKDDSGETKVGIETADYLMYYYGEQDDGDIMLECEEGQPWVFRQRLESALDERFYDEFESVYEVRWGELAAADDVVTVPLTSGYEVFWAELTIDRSDKAESYTVREIRQIDVSSIMPYEFFVKYRCFGLEPLESCGYFPVMDEMIGNALSEQFGDDCEDLFTDNFSEFVGDHSYIRLKNDGEDVSFRLCRRDTGERISLSDITGQTEWADLVWILADE